MRLATAAYDDNVAFDSAHLPHRITVNLGRMLGIAMFGLGALLVFLQVVIQFEEVFGSGAHLDKGAVDPFSVFIWCLAAALLCGFIWFFNRRDDIEINHEYVRVRQQRLWMVRTWEVPLGEYQGIQQTYTSHPDPDTMMSFDMWGINLLHADNTRTVSLWVGLRYDTDPSGKAVERDWGEEQVRLSERWAQDLGLRLLDKDAG